VLRRLGGAEALELCRDKRLVLVGDSLNRNMWESLACILYAAVPDRSRTRIVDDAGSEYRIFRAMVSDYRSATTLYVHMMMISWRAFGVRRLLLLTKPLLCYAFMKSWRNFGAEIGMIFMSFSYC
jgi:hypothetical protein